MAVFFAVISALAGLITLLSAGSVAGIEMPVKQLSIFIVVVSAMASTIAWTHFVRRDRMVSNERRMDAPANSEEEAQSLLLEQFRSPEFAMSGVPKKDAAALSHYLHEMNSELVKSVSAHMNDRPQKRKLLGD
jgi:hypothetical protein